VKGSIQKGGIKEHKGRLPTHPTFLFVNPLLLNLSVGQNKLLWVTSLNNFFLDSRTGWRLDQLMSETLFK